MEHHRRERTGTVSPSGKSGVNIRGFDCPGLTTYAFARAGVRLPRTAAAQAGVGVCVSRHQQAPPSYGPVIASSTRWSRESGMILSRLGDLYAAEEHLHLALDIHGLDCRRTRTIVLAELGGVRLRQGDVISPDPCRGNAYHNHDAPPLPRGLVLQQRFAIWPGQRHRRECSWPLACQGRSFRTAPPTNDIVVGRDSAGPRPDAFAAIATISAHGREVAGGAGVRGQLPGAGGLLPR
ncbi:NlpC/P60 family protein [Streptomyces sp. NPDC004082]